MPYADGIILYLWICLWYSAWTYNLSNSSFRILLANTAVALTWLFARYTNGRRCLHQWTCQAWHKWVVSSMSLYSRRMFAIQVEMCSSLVRSTVWSPLASSTCLACFLSWTAPQSTYRLISSSDDWKLIPHGINDENYSGNFHYLQSYVSFQTTVSLCLSPWKCLISESSKPDDALSLSYWT